MWATVGRESAPLTRPGAGVVAQHVDVVMYCFNPHRCKGVDMAFLKQLKRRVSIVPVLCKADTMTTAELKRRARRGMSNPLARDLPTAPLEAHSGVQMLFCAGSLLLVTLLRSTAAHAPAFAGSPQVPA